MLLDLALEARRGDRARAQRPESRVRHRVALASFASRLRYAGLALAAVTLAACGGATPHPAHGPEPADGARSPGEGLAVDRPSPSPPPPAREVWSRPVHRMPSVVIDPRTGELRDLVDASAEALEAVGEVAEPEPEPGDVEAIDAIEVASTQSGRATWYGGRFHGRLTASGERFDKRQLTAAHRYLPFGTYVRVKNLRNDSSVIVRINDRGPFGDARRIIDVSRRAAEELGMVGSGVVPVELEILAASPAGARS